MYSLPHPLALRNATDGDADFCRALYASTRDDLRQLPLPPALRDDLIAMQQRAHEEGRRARHPNAQVLILEHAGAPAGRVVLDTVGPDWRLVDLALLPEQRGRGLGRALLAALQARAAACGAGLVLSVLLTNESALRLYRRAGFEVRASDALHHEMAWRPA
jgi:ribosomal protein S18 acetylase RimI-like enzyme